MFIPLITGSTRKGRQSVKVARFLADHLSRDQEISFEYIDLLEYQLPILVERLMYLETPPEPVAKFAGKIRLADALVIVSPEYNGSYPGVLKNALDYLIDEYKGKPVGLVTVSSGPHGGKGCMELLGRFFTRMDAVVMKESFTVNNVGGVFSDDGATSEATYHTRATQLIHELKQSVIASKLETPASLQ
jgi:NAD(P)H-dependent FMN reductase